MNRKIHRLLKLSHHRHTSRRLPHHSTSYGVLVCLVLFTGAIMGLNSLSSSNAKAAGSSMSHDINLNGTVEQPAPMQKVVILSPVDGAKTGKSIVPVSGNCQSDTFVLIYRNNTFAGSTACKKGKFSIKISLTKGKNVLVAKVVDTLNQYGPDSDPVAITYIPAVGSPASQAPPLILSSDNPYLRSINVGKIFNLDLSVSGGKAPYAISVEWGDNGIEDTFPQAEPGLINIAHSYDRAGIHVINTQATDNLGNKATLQYIVIVNGPSKGAGAGITNESSPPYVEPSWPILWPLYLLLLALMLAFWLGEKYELHKLKSSHRLLR